MIDTETMTGLLRVLQSCGGIPVRENVIFGQFNSAAVSVQTMSTIREHLMRAYDKGWVDYLVDEDDKAKKWWITQAGKVNLAGR
ncbi:MAG: hypothetical protein NT011_13555 [Kiritimatiellaeota bacterium]|nr:hypothetical protein [Kiritimatiellota bacterium]